MAETTRGAAVRPTETDQKTRPDIDAVLAECKPLAEVFGNKTAFGRLYLAATALAAERDRADRAEARIANAVAFWVGPDSLPESVAAGKMHAALVAESEATA